jgi:hypothetical protein
MGVTVRHLRVAPPVFCLLSFLLISLSFATALWVTPFFNCGDINCEKSPPPHERNYETLGVAPPEMQTCSGSAKVTPTKFDGCATRDFRE